MPSEVGNLFTVSSPTGADGAISFPGIPAGRRRVGVTLVPGLQASNQEAVQEIDVVKGRTTQVNFTLVRTALP